MVIRPAKHDCPCSYLPYATDTHTPVVYFLAFGSTYARESKFTKEQWLSRLKNPCAITFIAMQPQHSSDVILASTTLIDPLPNETRSPTSNPYQMISSSSSSSSTCPTTTTNLTNNNDDEEPISFQMTAVYTTPPNHDVLDSPNPS
ncbi:hypothetical protein GGS20DRAFT_556495 [Poronia punctata]|nr:hypothetical protein GGS20DRAFT_556495 [Poronia punctata]